MSMFCYQCQETVKNKGCELKGVCGKEESTSNLHDLLVYNLQGIALYASQIKEDIDINVSHFISGALFATITNANFNDDRIVCLINEALLIKKELRDHYKLQNIADDAAMWEADTVNEFTQKAALVGINSYSDKEDIRSLKSLLLYGIKGIAAYIKHAAVLGKDDLTITQFFIKALTAIRKNESADALTALVLEAGQVAVAAMALLDAANTETFGHPQITQVNIGVSNKPGILISGHDLLDLKELLEQTNDKGIDIYTHSEMLPAHYYPELKKYKHLVGNYGSSWWHQQKDFDSFNGPIIMTTNCIVPVKESYLHRIFTTGMTGYSMVPHIADRISGKQKDFSEVIALAKKCVPPQQIEKGFITGGFAHNQVMALAPQIIEAVKSGKIKRFIVMAGCDGRHPSRQYFTDVAESLPKDAIILTAGCAKYRYNKLNLGDIGGIPRVLDAGQCNDSYSLAVIALKLKEVFGLEDINALPISFDIGWYEQKAVAVLLALLHLGVKGIRIGPTLPAFLSPNVAKLLIEKFNLKLITNVQDDVAAMMTGQ